MSVSRRPIVAVLGAREASDELLNAAEELGCCLVLCKSANESGRFKKNRLEGEQVVPARRLRGPASPVVQYTYLSSFGFVLEKDI